MMLNNWIFVHCVILMRAIIHTHNDCLQYWANCFSKEPITLIVFFLIGYEELRNHNIFILFFFYPFIFLCNSLNNFLIWKHTRSLNCHDNILLFWPLFLLIQVADLFLLYLFHVRIYLSFYFRFCQFNWLAKKLTIDFNICIIYLVFPTLWIFLFVPQFL